MSDFITLPVNASIETIYFKKSFNVKIGQFCKKQTVLGYYAINMKTANKKLVIEKAGKLVQIIPGNEEGCVYKRSAVYELDFVEDAGQIKVDLKKIAQDTVVSTKNSAVVRIDANAVLETNLLYFNPSDLIDYDKIIKAEVCTNELLGKLLDSRNYINSIRIAQMEPCEHKLIYNSMCTECYETNLSTKSFLIFDQISGLMTDTEHIDKKIENIKANKKLIMILDLDNTVIHAQRLTDPQKLDLYEKAGCRVLGLRYNDFYILKMRPFLIEFIKESLNYFEIFVYTFGTREYALSVLNSVDPDEKLLNRKRLITRDESKLEIKELDKILPAEYNDLLVIVDDTKVVWRNHKHNLVVILPFYFFKDDKNTSKVLSSEVDKKVENDVKKEVPLEAAELFINQNDCYLHFLARHLRLINKVYYNYQGRLTTPVG